MKKFAILLIFLALGIFVTMDACNKARVPVVEKSNINIPVSVTLLNLKKDINRADSCIQMQDSITKFWNKHKKNRTEFPDGEEYYKANKALLSAMIEEYNILIFRYNEIQIDTEYNYVTNVLPKQIQYK